MSWVLAANRSGARIFERTGRELVLVESVEHAQGRLRDGEIDSDRQGRSFDRSTAARHAFGRQESPHEHAARAFAKTLADRLRHGRVSGSYERLVLVAEPHFLGLLREALDEQTARLVVDSLPKDLSKVPERELIDQLPALPPRLT